MLMQAADLRAQHAHTATEIHFAAKMMNLQL